MQTAGAPQSSPMIVQTYLTALLAAMMLTGIFDLWMAEAERTINLHHGIAVLGGGWFFLSGRIVMPPKSITGFFMVLLVVSAIASLHHGLHPMTLNALYCFYLCLLGLLIAQILTHAQLRAALRASAWMILAGITVKNFFFIPEILDALSTLNQRVFIPTLVAGGTNLEATFALFAAIFLRGGRGYWAAFAYAMFLAILYSSRAAMVGGALLFIYEIFANSGRASMLFKQLRMIILAAAAVMTAVFLLSSPVAQFALARFQDIGYEPGSEGRLVLWQTAPEVFMQNPMGVGAGNAIHAIETALGSGVQEDNVHNIYLQILVDLGIIGFAAYGLMVFAAWRRLRVAVSTHPLWLAIGMYFILGGLQFRAYDPFLFLWLGLAWHSKPDSPA